MTDKINELLRRVEEFKPKAAAEIEEFRIRILGKKGELTALMEEFKTVAPELKRELGQQLNRLKNEATERINALREQLQNAAADEASSSGDLTRPGTAEHLGSRHPISLVKNQIVEVFSRLGYTVAAKLELVTRCTALQVRIVSAMGSGNKLDPTAFEVSDLSKTQGCPLARVMRKELRRRGISHLKVVWSREEPRSPLRPMEAEPPASASETRPGSTARRDTPGSISFVPAAAGLVLASAVVRDLGQF